MQRCQHPAPVFGCDWKGANLLATGCEDAAVRVFTITGHDDEEPVTLLGIKYLNFYQAKNLFRVELIV